MGKRKAETRVLYIVFDSKNNPTVIKYLSKVQDLTGINKSTLSKHFNKYSTEYKNDRFTVYKCYNVDLKGYYRNNFR